METKTDTQQIRKRKRAIDVSASFAEMVERDGKTNFMSK